MADKFPPFEPWKEGERLLIPHLSSATGDTIHVAAALVLYPGLDVVVIHSGPSSAGEELFNFYVGVIKIQARVKLLYTETDQEANRLASKLAGDKGKAPGLEGAVQKLLSTGTLQYLDKGLLRKIGDFPEFKTHSLTPVATDPTRSYRFAGNLSQATFAIANKFLPDNKVSGPEYPKELKQIYTDLAAGLSLDRGPDPSIIPKLNGHPTFRGTQLPDTGPVALLWARYTGTNSLTGYNPEGDSAVQGQTMLLDLLRREKFKVITIGHGPQAGDSVKGDVDVGEFYIEPPNTPQRKPTVKDRGWQTSFFLALMQTYPGSLFQIGQKSGGMDCAALLGVPTLYLEHKGSLSSSRMQKWVGKVPFYQHSETAYPPSRIGFSLRATFDEIFNGTPKDEQLSTVRASAQTRGACMIYKYALDMKEQERKQKVDDWVKKNKAKPKVKVEGKLPGIDEPDFFSAEELDEVSGDLAKKIQAVNLVTPGIQQAGYSEKDIEKVQQSLWSLKKNYLATTAIILTADGYKIRLEANIKEYPGLKLDDRGATMN